MLILDSHVWAKLHFYQCQINFNSGQGPSRGVPVWRAAKELDRLGSCKIYNHLLKWHGWVLTFNSSFCFVCNFLKVWATHCAALGGSEALQPAGQLIHWIWFPFKRRCILFVLMYPFWFTRVCRFWKSFRTMISDNLSVNGHISTMPALTALLNWLNAQEVSLIKRFG